MNSRPERRHYENAPVTEAVIDVQIEPLSNDLQGIDRLASSLKSQFPTRLPIRFLQMGFQVGSGTSDEFSNEQQNVGFRLDRPGRVLQVKTTGFTYSHLPPYSNWPAFSGEAQEYWSMYVAEVQPVRANRMAVRMINRLPLPKGSVRLDTCLNLYPTLPDSLPSDTQSLFMQLQIPMKHIDEGAVAVLGLYNAPVVPEQNAIMLDIDFFVQRSVPIDEVFNVLNRLGDTKDDIFEACITDAIRELIA
jgi:uncharacterized protein (TIGR04255 family)